MRLKTINLIAVLSSLLSTGCATKVFHQPGSEIEHIYSQVFISDYNTSWQATLDALKRFDKNIQNRQGGFVQTEWVDSTSDKNYTDSFGGDNTYVKSKYRLRVTVSQMQHQGKSAVKVSIMKDQVIQRDLLEGWRPVESDAIEEKTYLYRIGRLIHMKNRIKYLEDKKMQEVLEEGV